MMYASRNRRKAIRRWLPLNRGVRDALAKRDAGRNAGEDRICCGGAPARREGLAQTRRRSRAERGEDHGVRPRPPSRPRGSRRALGRSRQHDRADVLVGGELAEAPGQSDLCCPRSGHGLWWHANLTLSDTGTDVRAVLVGPGCFTELTAQMGITGPGDGAPTLRRARRVLRGHEAGEAHEGSRPREAAPVEHLGGQTQRTDSCHTPIGGQAWHLVTEGIRVHHGTRSASTDSSAVSRSFTVAR